ncbi:hypothetical protein PoB_001629800 [Plakobranchus ocellatus]|uniref:Uncharacterized protein n=1 Tax=Plakobranchus ocellatus TaxID=259542 RepID=A0AAV3Z4Z5_9GAST|nr:hypothetical protein PoB_001629800 [Plakobranchus ocellatus]
MHSIPERCEASGKPQIILTYNKSKGGVDTMDQMAYAFNGVFLAAANLALESVQRESHSGVLHFYTGNEARTRDRRVLADLRADSLATVPPTPPQKQMTDCPVPEQPVKRSDLFYL